MSIPTEGIPILGQTTPLEGGLSHVEVETAVSPQLMATVTVLVTGEADGRPVRLVGQLSGQELLNLAVRWLQVAVAGAHDAVVAQELVTSAGLPPAAALAFVERLEARRQRVGGEAKDPPEA